MATLQSQPASLAGSAVADRYAVASPPCYTPQSSGPEGQSTDTLRQDPKGHNVISRHQ